MYGYIYKTTDKKTGLIYIGQHKAEKFEGLSYTGSGNVITNIRNKLLREGKEVGDRLEVELIDTAESEDELNEKEIYWIDYFGSTDPLVGYNMSAGGHTPRMYREHNGFYGHKHSPETLQHLSEVHRRENIPPERIEKIRNSVNAWMESRTDEYKQKLHDKLSEACSGELNGMYGKKHTESSKKIMSEKRKANPRLYQSQEERDKRSATIKEWHSKMSEEEKAERSRKISEATKKAMKRLREQKLNQITSLTMS